MQIPQSPGTSASSDATVSWAPPPRQLAAGEGAGMVGRELADILRRPRSLSIGIFVIFVVISIALAGGTPRWQPRSHGADAGVGRRCPCSVAMRWPAASRCASDTCSKHSARFVSTALHPRMFCGSRLWFSQRSSWSARFSLTLGAAGLAALMDFGGADSTTRRSLRRRVVVVALLALRSHVLAAMAYWFAPALVVLNGEQPIAALQKSFAASCAELRRVPAVRPDLHRARDRRVDPDRASGGSCSAR